jgi:hypothetical protein
MGARLNQVGNRAPPEQRLGVADVPGDGRPVSPRRLQPLAKFFHYALTQKIGITLAGLGKFDNSLSDQLIRNIAAVWNSKS